MPDAENPAEDFLIAEIAPSLHSLFPGALRRAYASADRVVDTTSFLRTPGGKFQRGDLIACAAEYEVQRLIETGRLQYDFSWEFYARPTGKHLVVHTPRGRLTISQLPDADSVPRYAEFRRGYQATNTPYMFDQMNREVDAEDKKHILLVHGYRNLTFAHFTLPHLIKGTPIYQTDNLLALPHEVSDAAPPEGPSESPNPEAIEYLNRILRDQGDE